MTSGYLIAGYVLTWGALIVYVWRLGELERRTRRALESERSASANQL